MPTDSITRFEHQQLKVDNELFTQKHFDALVKFQDREQVQYFKVGHQSITFTQFVGVLKVANLTIEVLPKADKPTGKEDDKEKGIWQNVLIQMLRKVNGFDVQVTSDASLKLKPNAILHFYFEMFVKEVELLIHQGLVKRYRKEEGNQTSLKGSLQFGQHIQKNLTHQERFFVRYTTYDRNNPYNRVLLKTLNVLQNLNTSPALQSRISGLILNFPELPDIAVNEAFFEKLVINRKTEGYKKALQISKLILLNYHPDLSKGRNDVLALMFDMNDLWEKYVLVCLRKEKSKYPGLKINGQVKQNFWRSSHGEHKTIRPDILLEWNNEKVIIDTKWKIPKPGFPDDSDLKQLFGYNLYWRANRSFLLYPGDSGRFEGDFLHFLTVEERKKLELNRLFHSSCSQLWCTVLEGKELSKVLGKQIINAVFEQKNEQK